jgi:hypothetical protein
VRAWLAAPEASLLRSLVGQVLTLIAPDGDGPPAASWNNVAELEALFDAPARRGPAGPAEPGEPAGPQDSPTTPDDPVLARLLPDGYRDDPDAAG